MSRFIKVVVGDERGEAEVIVIRRDGVTGLDILKFVQDVIGLFDMEMLAQAEGRTFQHPLAGGVGALTSGNAARLGRLVAREGGKASPKIKNE
ncbi:hypothetical protein DIE11_34115 [Burkholderia sp. Bp9012]|uniref:hypothetical protein n=1 Tax=Burkholderia sp. Bp9012 TaxID=2184562 RepID=UPI000F599C74|nr:hypothetical protein [Burkholderia sp. Bp9012]RQR68967.1 hypothetical protein DIE11_34115 [Burkholderia sp. Bp9012]